MAVVMQHFCATAQEHCSVVIPSIPPHGYMAVDMFFFLSGFIMAYTYLDDFKGMTLTNYPRVLRKRAARIIPLNLFVVMMIVIMGQISWFLLGRNIIYPSGSLAIDIVSNVLMLQGLGVGTNLNGPSWSISTEVVAYVLFPIFVMAIGFARLQIACLAVLLCIALLFFLSWSTPRLGLDTNTTVGNLIRCLAEFGVGVFMHRVHKQQPSLVQFFAQDVVLTSTIIASVILLCLRLDLPAALLFPAIILGLASNRGRVAAIASYGFLHWLGLISFSLYLIHQPFRSIDLEILRSLHPAPVGFFSALAFAMAGSLLVVPFAYVVYRYIEYPGRNAVNALLGRLKPAALKIAPQPGN